MATAESKGGPWAALPPGLRKLLIEAGAIAGVIAMFGSILVLAFLLFQGRLDSRDPRLLMAPLDGDEQLGFS